MTEQEYRKWLRSPNARRTALVEVDTTPPLRLSVLPYTTEPSDPLPNIRYDALIKGGVGYDETLPLDGTSRASYSSIELHNEDGALDHFRDIVWKNKAIRVYYGDVTWERSDYKLVVTGVVDDCTVSYQSVSILLKDKMERLNNSMSDVLMGGTGNEAENLKPILLGECHNISPRLLHAGEHEYIFHKGEAERIIEVRDRGVPVEYTARTGGFKLTSSPDGLITLSAQGDKEGGYTNTVANLIKKVVKSYGLEASRFTDEDIDIPNFNAFNSLHPEPVGIYLKDRSTVQQVVVELANTLAAHPVMSRLGKLRLLRIELPPLGTPTVIQMSDYEYGSLEIAGQSEVVAGVRLGYCRQWTKQEIAEGIPEEHRDLFNQDWLTVKVENQAVADEYKIETETDQQNTLLQRKEDAQAEATRRLALWTTPRTIYRVRGLAQLLELELGQAVTLFGKRFGLDNGRLGQVVGLKPDWVAGRCDVEVLI